MPTLQETRQRGAAAVVLILGIALVIALSPYATGLVGIPVLHPKHPIHSFTPNGDCRYDRVRIRFRTTRSDDGTVQIVKPGGRLVITLARERFLKRYHFHTYYWNGRRREGGTAAPGRYKLRVRLLGQERVLVPPGVIKLHRDPRDPLRGCRAKRRGSR